MTEEQGRFSIGEIRTLRFIVLFVIVTRILLIFRSEIKIYTFPYTEDTFYLFTCAEHFAHGEGFTCDGKNATNGVQPLIVILYAPLFLIAAANKLLALKLGFLLIAVFDSFSVVFIARLVRLLQKKPEDSAGVWKSPPIIAALFWAVLYPILVRTANGLETGLYSMMILWTLYYYVKLQTIQIGRKKITIFQYLTVGILLGLTVLSRIDAVFFVIIIAGFELIRYKTKGIMSAAIISLTALIISSPWWWYNYSVFGSLMPQSGVAESMGVMIEYNLHYAAFVLGEIFSLFFVMPNYAYPAWVHVLWFAIVIVNVVLILWKFNLKNYIKNGFNFSLLLPYFFFCCILIITYVTSFNAPYMFARFFHPLRILWLLLASCALPEILRILKMLVSKRSRLILAAPLIVIVCALLQTGYKYGSLFFKEQGNDFYLVGKWASDHPNERIGMPQSGMTGFIAPNVVNLDGKVNFAALKAQSQTDIGTYIESEHLDYLADLPELVNPLILLDAKHGGKFQEIDSIGRVIIFKRVK